MDKNNSALDDFLGNLENESYKDPFTQEFEAPIEEPKEEVEEKPLPFNKDPKVQKFIEKEISKRLAEIKPAEIEQKNDTDEDDYYIRLIGNDTPEKVAMIREAKAREERMLEMAEERAFSRLSQKEQEEQIALQEAEQELQNAFDNIEEIYDIDLTSNSQLATKTRQEFVTFIEKIAPKDRNGEIVDYPDIQSAWETFSEMRKSTSQPSRAKELAARSMAKSVDANNQAQPLNKTAWESTDAFLESLGR